VNIRDSEVVRRGGEGGGGGGGVDSQEKVGRRFSIHQCKSSRATHEHKRSHLQARFLGGAHPVVAKFKTGEGAYVLNMYSRIPVEQPEEYEYRIPPGEPCL